MEVHHHSHHPKKWKEYITEFLMLFLAVSLGFLAENIREGYVEKEREHQYMESFVLDLEKDVVNLEKAIPKHEERNAAIDSVFIYFKNNPTAKELPISVIKSIKRVSWNLLAYRNTATISQLKNSGGLRLIKNKIVADSIANYDMRWTRIDDSHERYFVNQRDIYLLEEKMLNPFDALEAYIKNNKGYDNAKNIPENGTIKINPAPLGEYLNLLARQQIVTTQDARSYAYTLNTTKNLIHLIKKEYKIN